MEASVYGKKDNHIHRNCSHPETRVPEKKLFLATALFGGLGGCMGMYLLRHKTKLCYFALFFPLMLIAQIAVLVLL